MKINKKLRTDDWKFWLESTFNINLPDLHKAKYNELVSSDIINIFLVLNNGRDFCLLENNAKDPQARAEKINLYRNVLRKAKLSWTFDSINKKSMIVWNAKNPIAVKLLDYSVGHKLGYLDPIDDQDLISGKFYKHGSIIIFEKNTRLHLFGQSLFSLSIKDPTISVYCKNILRRLNSELKPIGLEAVAEVIPAK